MAPWRTLKGILSICTLLVFPVVVASILHGRLSFERAQSLSTPQDMYIEGETFRAYALSLVSIREAHGFQRSGLMFGSSSFQSVPSRVCGGADLTPFFLMEEDVIQCHRFWRTLCVDIVGDLIFSGRVSMAFTPQTPRPLTFKAALSGSRTKCGMVYGL